MTYPTENETFTGVRQPEAGRDPGLARRRLLYGLGAAAMTPLLASCVRVGAAAPPTAASSNRILAVPRIARVSRPGGTVHRTGFPITTIGINWTGPGEGVKVRLYDRKGRPSAWEDVRAGCPCGVDGRPNSPSAPLPTRAFVPGRNSFGYQIDAPADVDIVDATAVNGGPAPAPGPEQTVPQPSGSSVLARIGPAVVPFPPEDLLRRADWGADESKRFGPDGREISPPRFFPVQNLTVHHTVTANDDPDPAATVRAIYALHTTGNGWGDIGYHFLVDARGRVYEGRWSGQDAIPAHDSHRDAVVGFHTVGFNAGNIGIALLGDFTKAPPPPAMRRSLTRLLASLAQLHRLDPREAITYRNPLDGKSKRGMTLGGHRDWTATECCGDLAYRVLPGVRADVGKLLTAA
ncbi:peptidoglycan recognition family protein [Streptomyces sp. AK02-01A]|uniref:peptidoglycan recognition protein family protein n=1 Tax=Streptomyces sp. AK02-01A TaxID=3028648 RepID=UPI0029A08245|nr:peptidoglycan recognition family protein [Streptomyces sp. AK02-01A]MDX3850984.1 peptidoglycan recognition family protein [Streptomyces sp. AK02-01A]